jgi:ribosomal protein S18 acetylase RimI-like enzyme
MTMSLPAANPLRGATYRIVPVGPERDAYLPLFHLADDSVEQVLGYYQTGILLALHTRDGVPIGIVLVIDEADDAVELKAVAVDVSLQDRGVGTGMLLVALEKLRAGGVKRVVVGTSSSGIGPLAYYQKAGFRPAWIERDFFNEARGYSPDLYEKGIPVRDMIWMDLELVPLSP